MLLGFNTENEVFQSTPSTQRETITATIFLASFHISIHSLYAEGDLNLLSLVDRHSISIHSLYAEGDLSSLPKSYSLCDFNPLPLRRGRRGAFVWD